MDPNLCELLGEVDDITDPLYMDRLLLHLQNIVEEDNDYMKTLVEVLKDAHISWEQPWYQQTCLLTRKLKNVESATQNPLTGYITEKEKRQIEKNWQKFVKKYGVADKPICLARWRNTKSTKKPTNPIEQARRFVISYLARNVERTLEQVFKYFRRHYGCPMQGPYSPLEDTIIEICLYHCPSKAASYGTILLGREPRNIYFKVNKVPRGMQPHHVQTKWTLPMASKFLNLLLKYTELPLEELKYRTIDRSVWLKIAEDFNHTEQSLRRFWYIWLHVQIFVKADIKMKTLKKKICKKLKATSYEVWTDIYWKEFVNNFPDGMTPSFLSIIARRMVRKFPGYLTAPMEKLINYALRTIKFGHSKRLKTLVLNSNGELEEICYKSSKRKEME